MALLNVLARSAAPVFVDAAAGGDEFINDGATEFVVKNTGVSAVTVTAVADGRCDAGALHDEVATVNPGLYYMGPFSHERFGMTDGRVRITYSATANVQVMAKRQR